MNPFTDVDFSPAGCLPCCVALSECSCALLIPNTVLGGTPPYASYSDAASDISSFVANCLGYGIGPGAIPLDTYAVDVSTPNTVEQNATVTATGALVQTIISLSVKAGSTLTINWNDSFVDGGPDSSFVWELYTCDGLTVVDFGVFSDLSGSDTSFITTAGEYILLMTQDNDDNPSSCTVDWTVSSDDSLWVNTVIAIWDDGGMNRFLWACPKLLLPPLTEFTGTWYANAAAAASAITNLTSNCVGYIESKTNVTSFTATDGGTSLTLAETLTAGAMSSPVVWGGVNAVNGQTITVTGTVGAGTVGLNVNIYDDVGVLVEASGATASPWTSSALPYKGRYTISIAITSSSNTTSMSAVIASSGTLSVNQIQARYDLGLVCPATDDC